MDFKEMLIKPEETAVVERHVEAAERVEKETEELRQHSDSVERFVSEYDKNSEREMTVIVSVIVVIILVIIVVVIDNLYQIKA